MNYNICVFAGTAEGRLIAECIHNAGINVIVCVATEYGEVLINNIKTHTGRLDSQQMTDFFKLHRITTVIDATHPYAAAVTDNIVSAADTAGIEYIRLLRDSSDIVYGSYFSDIKAAAEYLKTTDGNILLTTGSKDLHEFSVIDNYAERIYPRVLPVESSLDICRNCGYKPSHIIAMQGPFTEEINAAMIKMFDIKYIVTKESGTAGGFAEKISAAIKSGIECVVIGRPPQVKGYSFDEVAALLNIKREKQISIIGAGLGNPDLLTAAAHKKLKESDIVIGAERVVESCNVFNKPYRNFILSGDIINFINESNYSKYAVVMSGDIGFYSGAKNLVEKFPNAELICGISSPVYMASKLGLPWENMKLCSLHARDCNLIHYVKTNRYTFALTGGKFSVQYIIGLLRGIDCKIYVGERLSYPGESVSIAENNRVYDSLSSVIIENPNPISICAISDDDFIRTDKIPMTKSEIRTLSVAKLKLSSDSVVYDIGAGTGSVTVEIANTAYDGIVYAVEKKSEAVDLILRNISKFNIGNIITVEGTAPDILSGLPAPTHAFIGGSSGNLADIVDALTTKNPCIRIVINAITLETVSEALRISEKFNNSEIICVTAAKSKITGGYNMMTGQNPVYIIALENKNE